MTGASHWQATSIRCSAYVRCPQQPPDDGVGDCPRVNLVLALDDPRPEVSQPLLTIRVHAVTFCIGILSAALDGVQTPDVSFPTTEIHATAPPAEVDCIERSRAKTMIRCAAL